MGGMIKGLRRNILSKLEKNWKKWKEDRQINESKYLKRVKEKIRGRE